MKKINYILFFLSVFSCLHCTVPLGPEAYRDWVQDYDNGLHIQKSSGEYVFDLQYMTPDYTWLQNKSRDRKDIAAMEHFVLRIEPVQDVDLLDAQVSTMPDKQRRLYYFSYLFQDDITLEVDGKRKPCILYHFERGIDLKHQRSFVIGFEADAVESKACKVIINSPQLSSLPIVLKISKDHLPALEI